MAVLRLRSESPEQRAMVRILEWAYPQVDVSWAEPPAPPWSLLAVARDGAGREIARTWIKRSGVPCTVRFGVTEGV